MAPTSKGIPSIMKEDKIYFKVDEYIVFSYSPSAGRALNWSIYKGIRDASGEVLVAELIDADEPGAWMSYIENGIVSKNVLSGGFRSYFLSYSLKECRDFIKLMDIK
jgi:hypothetical protein